ncbi:MAG: hydroxyethylthiazole kinase [Lachnospiraceae bacterium]|nr:hydroxyethylthiazole kinase [Lachnospiraceae bacterium]
MLREILENVRKRAPRIHCITNFVTMNDCANILLACGASPIMAFDEAETAEIAAQCDGLVINMGTLRQEAIPAMLSAGKRANELGRPVVLDPVGAGASAFRTKTALRLLEEIRFSVIRGNVSELRALSALYEKAPVQPLTLSALPEVHGNEPGTPELSGSCGGKIQRQFLCGMQENDSANMYFSEVMDTPGHSASGVDADASDRVTDENLDGSVTFAKAFSKQTGAVVAMTGAIDIVADARTAFLIRNGHPMMSRVTGTGCQLSAVTAAFLAANWEAGQASAAAAVCAMGICGETAFARLNELEGNATYRNYIIDAMFRLTPESLEQGAKVEIR